MSRPGAPQGPGTLGKPRALPRWRSRGALHEIAQSSRASSDSSPCPGRVPQVSSTSTCFRLPAGSTARRTQPASRPRGRRCCLSSPRARVCRLDVVVAAPGDVDGNLGSRRPRPSGDDVCKAGGPCLTVLMRGVPSSCDCCSVIWAVPSACKILTEDSKEARGARKWAASSAGRAAYLGPARAQVHRRGGGPAAPERAWRPAPVGHAAVITERPASVGRGVGWRRSCSDLAQWSTSPAARGGSAPRSARAVHAPAAARDPMRAGRGSAHRI